MSGPSSWFDNTPPPDLPTVSDDELIDIWASNRNTMLGRVAADEMMTRQQARRKTKLENSK